MSDYTIEKQEVHPESVGQYTGLKDMNGREIYEGDILEDNDYLKNNNYFFIAGFDMGGFMAQFRYKIGVNKFENYCPLNGFLEMYNKATVVGNIYENPELLEVQND